MKDMAWKKYSSPFIVEKLGVKKPKRTIMKYKVSPAIKGSVKEQKFIDGLNTKHETFEEYASDLGVSFPDWDVSRRKRNKGKITTHGVDRVRVAKQGPKPKRMLRVDCEGKT